MANEITVQVSLTITTSEGAVYQRVPAQFNVTQAGVDFTANTQEIGTSAEDLFQGAELGTPGWMIVHNLDATNFIELGHDDGGFKSFIVVMPGKFQVFQTSQATPQARADTAPARLEYAILEV